MIKNNQHSLVQEYLSLKENKEQDTEFLIKLAQTLILKNTALRKTTTIDRVYNYIDSHPNFAIIEFDNQSDAYDYADSAIELAVKEGFLCNCGENYWFDSQICDFYRNLHKDGYNLTNEFSGGSTITESKNNKLSENMDDALNGAGSIIDDLIAGGATGSEKPISISGDKITYRLHITSSDLDSVISNKARNPDDYDRLLYETYYDDFATRLTTVIHTCCGATIIKNYVKIYSIKKISDALYEITFSDNTSHLYNNHNLSGSHI